MWQLLTSNTVLTVFAFVVGLTLLYLIHINRLLTGTPDEVKAFSPRRWTAAEIAETYDRLKQRPIDLNSNASKLPPKLDRRYIVTGGSGK